MLVLEVGPHERAEEGDEYGREVRGPSDRFPTAGMKTGTRLFSRLNVNAHHYLRLVAQKVFAYGSKDVDQYDFLIHHSCAVIALRREVKHVAR